ncbi:regulator of chromosome condensation 1/beta-lactamase-inhibitor protein II [Baffinella frigidus]|nr:regulator of chromosome condensation 1/beta-lactamase-inhibitor protein II [Cryptophyta sp. CCMP2293]
MHTALFLSSGGELWSAGSNKFGELGIGKTTDKGVGLEKPQKIANNFASKVVDISCGVEFSMCVTEDGRVFSFGHPEFGALGHGTDGKYIISTAKEGFREESTPKHIQAWHMSDNKGKDYLGAMAEAPSIKRVFCGNKHTLAVDENGGLWSWGNNGYGRLGLNDPHERKRPCKIEFFEGPHAIKNFDLVVAGKAGPFLQYDASL